MGKSHVAINIGLPEIGGELTGIKTAILDNTGRKAVPIVFERREAVTPPTIKIVPLWKVIPLLGLRFIWWAWRLPYEKFKSLLYRLKRSFRNERTKTVEFSKTKSTYFNLVEKAGTLKWVKSKTKPSLIIHHLVERN